MLPVPGHFGYEGVFMRFAYYVAENLDDAIRLLQQDRCRVIAGGTDLMIDLRQGSKQCEAVVDVTNIPETKSLFVQDNFLRVGACRTFTQLETDPLVLKYAKALAVASSFVGSPQIRNVATPGGNVANAMPAADAAVALFGLQASAEICGINGHRVVPIEECYIGIGKSVIDSEREFIVSFLIPVAEKGFVRKSAYKRFALRESLALPVVAVSVGIQVNAHRIVQSNIVLAPAGIAPWHAVQAERSLQGRILDEACILETAATAVQTVPFRDSPVRCTAQYKKMIANTLIQEALMEVADSIGTNS